MSADPIFYVYCLFRPWNCEPCYIGKGKDDRVIRHFRGDIEVHPNKHLAAIIKKAGGELPHVMIHEGLDEKTALEYERALIAAIGRSDLGKGPLCNWTDGGEGMSGIIISEERRAKMSASAKAQFLRDKEAGYRPCNTPEAIAKRAASNRGQKRSAEFCEEKRRHGKAQFEREIVTLGVRACNSPEANAKVGSAHLGNKYRLGSVLSAEHKEKIGASTRGKKKSPEVVARMTAARRIRAQRENQAREDRQRTQGVLNYG